MGGKEDVRKEGEYCVIKPKREREREGEAGGVADWRLPAGSVSPESTASVSWSVHAQHNHSCRS